MGNQVLTMIELFSGIGAQERALRQLAIPYSIVATCDLDKDAVLSYAAMRFDIDSAMNTYQFPTQDKMIEELQNKGFGYDFMKGKHTITSRTSINKLKQYYIADKLSNNLGDISKVERLPYADIVTYSFPCFTGDMLVMTNDGFMKIKDITTNQLVMTHKNEFRNVIDSKYTGDKQIWEVSGMCFDKIDCTENHKFFARKIVRHSPTNENGKRYRIREFENPRWVECCNLNKNDYLGIAINQNSILPSWNGIDFNWSDGRKTRHKNELSALMDNHSFWWIIGRYLGDGLVRSQGGIIICCAKDETEEILPHLKNCGFQYSISEERTVNKIHIPLKELEEFVKPYGKGAANKRLPGYVFDMPTDYLEDLIIGYMSADGSYTHGLHKVSSVSKELIYGFGQLVAKVYKIPYRIYHNNRKPIVFIEGRQCNQKEQWQLVWKDSTCKQDKAFYENGYIWFPIRSITKTNRVEAVYDIEVDEYHSFTVNGCIVHNCTDLSVAGKGEGIVNKCSCGYSWPINFSDDSESLICPSCGAKVQSSTRSGLLGQVQRLLAVSKNENTLPKYLLLENVKNLVGKKFKPQFDAWVSWLDSIGYNTYYQVLNAKHYGIPQNRERIFALSIHKDVDNGNFKFPEQIPLTTRLKDILEKTVDEKYYLSGDKVESILANFIARQNEASGINLKDQATTFDGLTDVAHTLTEGIAPTVMSNSHGKTSGGYTSPKILVDESPDKLIKVEVPQTVNVRKYEVDVVALQKLLRDAKSKSSFTNKDIAEKLNQSLTTVEHWFRTDECFSIPTPDVWMSLKELLNITTNEFDESITTFEERLGVFEKSNRCYLENGISPTITCGQNEKIIVSEKSDVEPFIVASRGRNPENPSDRTTGSPTEQRLEANVNGITNTITTVAKDNYVMEPIIYDDYNSRIPKDQNAITTLTTNCGASAIRSGVKIIEPTVCEQRCDEGLRFFKDDVVGTLRTIDACGDKRVIEPELRFVGGIGNKDWAKDGKQLSRNYPQGNRVYSADGIATSLTAQGVGSYGGASGLYAVDEDINPVRIGNIYGEQFGTGYAGNVWDQDSVSPTIMTAQGGNRQPLVVDNVKWRIRKLTPKECWRLMSFSDEDCNRASKYVSDSALYKQAGNSIVTSCLVAIFYSLLFNDGSTKWSDYIVQYKINGGN